MRGNGPWQLSTSLVSATISERTIGCTTEVIDVVVAAVLHFNVGGPVTTV